MGPNTQIDRCGRKARQGHPPYFSEHRFPLSFPWTVIIPLSLQSSESSLQKKSQAKHKEREGSLWMKAAKTRRRSKAKANPGKDVCDIYRGRTGEFKDTISERGVRKLCTQQGFDHHNCSTVWKISPTRVVDSNTTLFHPKYKEGSIELLRSLMGP